MPVWVVTVLAAVAALLAAATATAAPMPKMIWGPTTLPDGASAFPVYEDLGVDVVQMQLQWRSVATARPASPQDPADPAYRWPATVDVAYREAYARGMRLAIMVKTTPDWANGGQGPAAAPSDDRDYADFLVAAARRYPAVRHWMIWGEPQRGDSFEPMPRDSRKGPRRYARLLDAAYGALKRQSRANKVIGGNTWTLGVVSPRDFLKWMRLPNGRPPRMDLFGHNPFSIRYPNARKKPYYDGLRDMSDVDTFGREVARAYRRFKRKPRLWLSEFTVPSSANNTFNFFVSPTRQARWLKAGFRIARRDKRVVAMGWFNLVDGPDLPTGLLRADGVEKPAYAAFKSLP